MKGIWVNKARSFDDVRHFEKEYYKNTINSLAFSAIGASLKMMRKASRAGLS